MINKKYEYSSLQINVPDNIKNVILQWSKENIKDEYLTDDGRELDTHITVLYGIDDEDDNNVKKLLNGKNIKINIKFGKITKFKNNENFDVIKLSIFSKALHKLHHFIENNIDASGNKFDVYQPHCTLAYVKKNSCDHLLNQELNLESFNVNNLTFSHKDNVKFTEIILNDTIKNKILNLEALQTYASQKEKMVNKINKIKDELRVKLEKIKPILNSEYADEIDKAKWQQLLDILIKVNHSNSEPKAQQLKTQFYDLWRRWELDKAIADDKGSKQAEVESEKTRAGIQIYKLLDRIAGHIALSDDSKSKEIIADQLRNWFRNAGIDIPDKLKENIIDNLQNNSLSNLITSVLTIFSPYQIIKKFFSDAIKILTTGTAKARKNKFRAIIIEMENNLRAIKSRRDAFRLDVAQLKRLFRQAFATKTEAIWSEFYEENLLKISKNFDEAVNIATEIVSLVRSQNFDEAEAKIKELQNSNL